MKSSNTGCSVRAWVKEQRLITSRAGGHPANFPSVAAAMIRSRPKSFLPRRSITLGMALFALLLVPPRAKAQGQKIPSSDLAEASLEDLMNIKVTSVSRKEQVLSKVAAAIYVITQEDIRRSGATNIPDLLRMVPGLEVAQIDANSWAISSRGFNDQFANKLLVLIDGRSIYDPLFAGVYWDQQVIPLEDIERIEVIRGPGATVWGANAVDGVINIITKTSKATQGGLLTAGAGLGEAHGLIQYGGKIGSKGTYRIFAGYDNYNNLVDEDNRPAADGWHLAHAGFRSDWDLSNHDALTIQGDILTGGEGQTINSFISLAPPLVRTFSDAIRPGGGNILGRWTRILTARSETSLQVYYDGLNRSEFGGSELWHTFDVDFQNHVALGSRQDVVWGAGYRSIFASFRPGYAISLNPSSRFEQLSSAFFQDEVTLTDTVQLTLGSKLEHNSFTGFEAEPGVRMAWSPTGRQTVWAAVSRSIRQPTPADDDVRYNAAAFPGPAGINTLVSVFGNTKFRSEELAAYELGYRVEPAKRISLDFAAFYNVYHHLRTTEPGNPSLEIVPPPPHILVPQMFDNNMHAQTYGAEVTADWDVLKRWKLTSSYSWARMSLKIDPSSLDSTTAASAGYIPRHQFQVRSHLALPRRIEFDSAAYYVGRLPALNVPAYTRVDARLAWHSSEHVELSVVGQNLLDDRHLEMDIDTNPTQATQARRRVYGEITWRF
jgi:iron complex outermembrane receptor protein